MKKTIAFRVDASDEIGTGHVMRCLALAEELKDFGFKSKFFCRAHSGHMAELIKNNRHEVELLPIRDKWVAELNLTSHSNYESWLGANWSDDVREVLNRVKDHPPDWLVVDHYGIDVKWERFFSTNCSTKIAVIDGLGNRSHCSEILLDPTYSGDPDKKWMGLIPTDTIRLAGPKYMLLRREFFYHRREAQSKSTKIKRILLSFGGKDINNVTQDILSKILLLRERDFEIDIIVGSGYKKLVDLRRQCKGIKNITIHLQPKNLAELMGNADMAISGGGVMLLEQCFLGVPSLVITTAENQINSARELHDYGAVFYLGHYSPDTSEGISIILSDFMSNLDGHTDMLRKMSELSRSITRRPAKQLSCFLRGLNV